MAFNKEVADGEELGCGVYPALITREGIYWLDSDDEQELAGGHTSLRAALYRAEHWDDCNVE
jgi:hypothetical protein